VVAAVDTSIWIDHLRSGHPTLVALLQVGSVLGHPWVTGEIALGRLADRRQVLGLLGNLPSATATSAAEVRLLIEQQDLAGSGIGFVDAQLLASTHLTPEHGCGRTTSDWPTSLSTSAWRPIPETTPSPGRLHPLEHGEVLDVQRHQRGSGLLGRRGDEVVGHVDARMGASVGPQMGTGPTSDGVGGGDENETVEQASDVPSPPRAHSSLDLGP